MIYTASYTEVQNHHGKPVPISRTTAKGFSSKNALDFFIPSSTLLKDWKAKKLSQQEFIDKYREEIRTNLPSIKEWLATLNPQEDITLLSHEKTTDKDYFSYRNLVIKFVEKYRKECFGGCDTPEKVLANA